MGFYLPHLLGRHCKAPCTAGDLACLAVLKDIREKSSLALGTLTCLSADEEEQESRSQRAVQKAGDESTQAEHKLHIHRAHPLPFHYPCSWVFNVKEVAVTVNRS